MSEEPEIKRPYSFYKNAMYLRPEQMLFAVEKLESELYRTAVAFALSSGITTDPNPLLKQCELKIRIPLNALLAENSTPNVEEMDIIYQRIQALYKEFEE